MSLSEDGPSIVTFASAGFLIATIMIFSLVALPELLPTIYPQLRHGSLGVSVISTSGQLVGPPMVSGVEVTVNSIAIHRVGVGEGAWIALLRAPIRLSLMEIGERPVSLNDTKVSIGDYNLVMLAFGDASAIIRGQNVTLKRPTQDLKVSVALTVTEGKNVNLILDLSFNEAALAAAQSFDPYPLVTVEQPGHGPLSTIASLKPLASLGPETLNPGETKSSQFVVEPGSVAQNYLVHARSGGDVDNTFDVEIAETGEFWYDLTGDLWFLGGNLTAGAYTMNVYVSEAATTTVGLTVTLYRVPRISEDLPDASFSGLVPSDSSMAIQVNEFALYFDRAGLYDFYLGAQLGDYEFLVDNNPVSVVSKDETVTLQLESGLHTFQIFADFSGSGRDTLWSVGVVPVPGQSGAPLSREATVATVLLLIAAIVFVADLAVRRIRRRGIETYSAQPETSLESA